MIAERICHGNKTLEISPRQCPNGLRGWTRSQVYFVVWSMEEGCMTSRRDPRQLTFGQLSESLKDNVFGSDASDPRR